MVTAYKELQGQNDKLQSAHDESKRRITELQEAYALDQGAKQHLAASFQEQLDEKDEKIKVLNVQIDGLKAIAREGGSADATALKDQIARQEALLKKCHDSLKYGLLGCKARTHSRQSKQGEDQVADSRERAAAHRGRAGCTAD